MRTAGVYVGFLLCVIAVAAYAATAAHAAPRGQSTQDRYVDLSVSFTMTGGAITPALSVTVANSGGDPAQDVEVSISIENPPRGTFHLPSSITSGPLRGEEPLPVGSFSSPVNVGVNAGTWSIPVVPPGTNYTAHFEANMGRNAFMWQLKTTVMSMTSYESELRRANNHETQWWRTTSSRPLRINDVSYGAEVTLEEKGQGLTNVIVTMTASRRALDGCVDVWLPSGSSLDTSSVTYSDSRDTYEPGGKCRPASPDDVSGAFRLASGVISDRSVTLPVRGAMAGQCVRAHVSALPPTGPGEFLDDPNDNEAEACFGSQPPERELFESGEVALFTVFDCFSRQTDPCDGTDGVRVRAVNKNVDPETIMAPGTTIVQVQDPAARVYDSYIRSSTQQSVTDANTVSWQTATDVHANFTGTREGVKIFFSRIPFNGQLNNWVKVAGEHVAVRGLDGGDPPGDMYIRTSLGSAITRMESGSNWTATYSGTSSKSDSSNPSEWFAEFEKLGTYVLEYTTIGNRDDTNGDCQTEYLPSGVTAAYCDTETYTFHVGPVAELGVRDGGTSAEAPASRRAFTIEAVNNGPDPSQRAEVTVRLPAGVSVDKALPSAGVYDAARSVWVFDELLANRPQTLVLTTDAAEGTEITASIAQDTSYTVCIDSNGDNLDHDGETACTGAGGSWHEGTIFDYLDSNNRASIGAHRGATTMEEGGEPPGMVMSIPAFNRNMVSWTPPSTSNRPVSWDVEYSDGAEWTPLAHGFQQVLGLPIILDRNPPDDRRYRVRARYETEISVWTEQTALGAAGTAAAGDPGVTISPTSLSIREGSRGSYTVRLDARPAGNVVIDVSNSNPDVRVSVNPLTFTPSNWNRPQTVYVTAADDRDTVDETDTISHVIDQAATSFDYDYFVLPDVSVTVTDPDTGVSFTVGGSSRTELGVDEGDSTTYELALGTRPEQDVYVSLSYPGGIIEVSPRNLTFTPDNYNQPQTITVTGVQDDDAVDNDQGFICHSFSGGYAESECLVVVVTDDDRGGVGGEVELALSDLNGGWCPGQWPEQLTGAEIRVTGYPEEAGGCFYSLRLNAAPTGNVTVTIRTDASKTELDADLWTEGLQNRFTFTQENWRDFQDIGFWPIYDLDGVHNNDFVISHSVSGGGYNGVVVPDITVNVVDNDRDYIGIRVETPSGGLLAIEGDRSTADDDLYYAAFYVFPQTRPLGNVTVSMSSDNPDVTLSHSSLTFTPSNWDQGYGGAPGRRVIVRAAEDGDTDDEKATITFTVTSSDADYDEREVGALTVTVLDNDPK